MSLDARPPARSPPPTVPRTGALSSRSIARPSRCGIGILRRKAFAQECPEIAVRLIDYPVTNEIRASTSVGRLEHFARAVEVGEERIDL